MYSPLLLATLLSVCFCLTPIVTLHGIVDTASSMDELVDLISKHYNPDVYIHNAEIGNGFWDSILKPCWDQVDLLHDRLKSDSKLSDGFHAIAHSQGSLLMRGYIMKYNDPPVLSFTSLAGPQNGVFGIPKVLAPWLSDLIAKIPYSPWVQNAFSFAQYWRDPHSLDVFVQKSMYLSEINNEKQFKHEFKVNFERLKFLLLFYSVDDEVIIPPESGTFSGFLRDSSKEIVPMNQTNLYVNNLFGLRSLDESHKLKVVRLSELKHNDFKSEKFLPYLKKFVFPMWFDFDFKKF
ncbi:hypothetical protein GEMRC1_008511 [Eukaryota sp. GEM-RC1]